MLGKKKNVVKTFSSLPFLPDVNAEAEEGMVATTFAGKIRNIKRVVELMIRDAPGPSPLVVTRDLLYGHINRNGPVAGFAKGTLGRDLSLERSLHPETLPLLEEVEQYTELEDLHEALMTHTGQTLPRGDGSDKDIGAARWGGGNPNNPNKKPGSGKYDWAGPSTWYPSLFDRTKQTAALQEDIVLYAFRGFLTCGAKVKAKANSKLAVRDGLSTMVKPDRGWTTLVDRKKAIDGKYATLAALNKLSNTSDYATASKEACYHAAAIVHAPRWALASTDGHALTAYEHANNCLGVLDDTLNLAEINEIKRQETVAKEAKAKVDKAEAEATKAKRVAEAEATKKAKEEVLLIADAKAEAGIAAVQSQIDALLGDDTTLLTLETLANRQKLEDEVQALKAKAEAERRQLAQAVLEATTVLTQLSTSGDSLQDSAPPSPAPAPAPAVVGSQALPSTPLSAAWLEKEAARSGLYWLFTGSFFQQYTQFLPSGRFKHQVDLAVMDVPWGRRMAAWQEDTRKDLRTAMDYYIKEGGRVLLFCELQTLMLYVSEFETQIRCENGTFSRYKLDQALTFAKKSTFVVPRGTATGRMVSGGEYGAILTRMRYKEGKFAFNPGDLLINITECEERFGGKLRPNDGKKWINTIWDNIEPPTGRNRLSYRTLSPDGGDVPKTKQLFCEKSPALMEMLVTLYTKGPGAKVWDPASGSGATFNASFCVQRRAFGAEKNTDLCLASKRRTLGLISQGIQIANNINLAPDMPPEIWKAAWTNTCDKFRVGAAAVQLDSAYAEFIQTTRARKLLLGPHNYPPGMPVDEDKAPPPEAWSTLGLELVDQSKITGVAGEPLGMGVRVACIPLPPPSEKQRLLMEKEVKQGGCGHRECCEHDSMKKYNLYQCWYDDCKKRAHLECSDKAGHINDGNPAAEPGDKHPKASCEQHLRVIRFRKGETIAYHYGLWGLEKSRGGVEIGKDNFKIPHQLFDNFVLVTGNASAMKWVNDANGTGKTANVLVHCAIGPRDCWSKVRVFVQNDVSRILPCVAKCNIYVGDGLYHDYGDQYWASVQTGEVEGRGEGEDSHVDDSGEEDEADSEGETEMKTSRGLNFDVIKQASSDMNDSGEDDEAEKKKKSKKSKKSKKKAKKKENKDKKEKNKNKTPTQKKSQRQRKPSQAQRHVKAGKGSDEEDDDTEEDERPGQSTSGSTRSPSPSPSRSPSPTHGSPRSPARSASPSPSRSRSRSPSPSQPSSPERKKSSDDDESESALDDDFKDKKKDPDWS